ncbi:MAG: hypothetical protein F4123_09925 [Gemmatimonadetes bacterium]|nr:hypothetical protein [Gemmatimonadota bacterium]
MNRLKLLAAAMLLALPIISACGDDVPPPPPTGSIDGLVSIEGQGIDGVSVTLSNGATVTTTNAGMFRFSGVEAGAYTVTISNYPDDASFNQTSAAATIATDGENVTVNFPGTWIRTAAIMGAVTVENEGLGGVTVKLSGMSDSETLTDGSGQYAFSGLRAGNYTVQISGFDDEDVAFGSTSSPAMVAVGESKVVTFEGTYLRSSAITGQVTVENNPLEGVTVSLQGKGEDRTETTNGAGQFTFSELRRGDYSVGITNPDIDEYSFDVTSKTITVAHGETGEAYFNGILLRTATIIGTVTVEGVGGIPDVTVTIQGGERGQELTETTNAAGQFRFTDLYAGDYSVGISGFDDDLYGFDVTTGTVTVERKATATVKPFEGIELRTAGIEGTITVDGGHPLPGVTVTVTGGPKDEEHTRVTNDAGYYMVDELHAGVYTVAITDYDENEYEFEATTRTIDVGLRTTATVAFQGDLLRTGGISGRVSVGGMGLDGITVTLSGDADGEMMTADGGQYAFTGLAEGDYAVEIEGWDDDLYAFETAMMERHVAQDASEIVNFDGTHRENNTISGSLFLDEIDVNMMQDQGEPAFAQAGIPLILQGPGVNEVRYGASMPDGSYAFPDLVAGSYRVLINMTDTVAAGLTEAGFRFSGELTGEVANVSAGDGATVNFPFRIVMQTIHVGAVMGTSKMATDTRVGGVALTLYPTVEDADNGTNALGTGTTGADDTKPDFGMAKFDFPRAMDLGPGGQGMDHLVFAKVTSSGNAALEVADNAHIEIEYAGTDRVSAAPAAARLLNTAVSFQWWVKSKSGVPNGDRFLGGWNAIVGDTTIATGDSAHADATMKAAAADHGKGSFSGTVAIADLDDNAQAKYTVKLDVDSKEPAHDAMQPDGGEMWTQSAALTHTHNALNLPPKETADEGAISVTWTTQSLVVGVYRERDDVPGFIGHISHRVEDDKRPAARVAAEMVVEIMRRNDRGRLEKYEWYDHDDDPTTDPIHPTLSIADGLVTARHLPANMELTVRLDAGLNRALVTEPREYVETFGQDLALGTTVGAFGAMSGGGPQVRLCTSSIDTSADDGDCATFGYQWTTGSVTGSTAPAVRGLPVTLEAVTDKHGARNQDGTTSAAGSVNFTVQDGTYDISASADANANWAIVSPETVRVWCYHDEYADEMNEPRADSAWVGRACFEPDPSASWTMSRRSLEIRGFVANVDHEFNSVVRGDETYAGAMLKATGTAGQGSFDATVGADGLYKFTGLPQGTYTITAVNGSDHEMLRYGPDSITVTGASASHQYVDVNEQNATLNMPLWNYETSRGQGRPNPGSTAATSLNDAVTVGTGMNAVNLTFYNFALLHADGTYSGALREATDNPAQIAVELRRCLVYSAADTVGPGTADDIPESCTPDNSFRAQVKQAGPTGNWSFGSLREGYYRVNIAGPDYRQAKWGSMGIDDDAANCGPGTENDFAVPGDNTSANICDTRRTRTQYDLLKGDQAFNSDRALFYIYNNDLRGADSLAAVTIKGVQTVGDTADFLHTGTIAGAVAAAQAAGGSNALGATDAAITFGDGGSILVTATVSGGASYVVRNLTATGDLAYAPTATTGATVPLAFTRTPAAGGPDAPASATNDNSLQIEVTGENGYNDHWYTFTALRNNPAGNELAAAEVTANGNAAGGSGTTAAPYTVTTGSATANDVIVNFTMFGKGAGINLKCVQTVAVYAPGATTAETQIADTDAVLCTKHYRLTAGTTGTTYRVVMTSEDGRTRNYWLNVSRG